MKKIVWLCLFLCLSILQASDQKRMKTEHRVTMYQGFVDLLQENPGQKSLDELEDQVRRTVSLRQLQQAVEDKSCQSSFEHKKMYPNVAQLCAIFRVKLLLREMGGMHQETYPQKYKQKMPSIFDDYIRQKLQLD